MRHSIRTLGVPTRTGTGAFTVIPARSSTASFNGQNIVTGAPGTVPVRSPRPTALRDDSWGGSWQPSSVSPDVILPSIYVARIANMQHQQGGLYSGNRVPVPAVQVNAIPKNFSKPARIGGQTTTRAVRPFVTYPVYGQ
jgi:hypothetical protein